MVLYVHVFEKCFYDMCSDSTVLVDAVVVTGMKNTMFLAIWKGRSDVKVFISCLFAI